MSAFNGAPLQSPPRTGPSAISLASPPAPPPKDVVAENHVSRRTHAAVRQAPPSSNRRASGGGLTGQYSTSMPASGGYFPDPNEPIDEAAMQRKERQRERDAKRRALKAAWGTDNREYLVHCNISLTTAAEPFEDFGGSPGDGGSVDRVSVNTSPQSNSYLASVSEEVVPPEANNAALVSARPMRSPGLRLGVGPRTPPIRDEGANSPPSEISQNSRSSNIPANTGGVQRTKSLMKKIRIMVRQRSGSVESGQLPKVRPSLGVGQRSQSMTVGLTRPATSPGWAENEYVVEEEHLADELPDDQFENAPEDVFGSAMPSEMGQRSGAVERRVMSEDRRYAARR